MGNDRAQVGTKAQPLLIHCHLLFIYTIRTQALRSPELKIPFPLLWYLAPLGVGGQCDD